MSDDDDGLTSWEELRARMPVDERRAAALERLGKAETLLYEMWSVRV